MIRRAVAPLKSHVPRGFTLIELLVVITLIAIAVATVSLSLRDPAANHLEQEAARLSALLEAARAEARAAGIDVRWEVASAETTAVDGTPVDFRFIGLPPDNTLPTRWLEPGVTADIVGARAVVLGPEPFIGPQRVVLRLDAQRLELQTDGLGPFTVVTPETSSASVVGPTAPAATWAPSVTAVALR